MKPRVGNAWGKYKYYPKHFKTKREEFMYQLTECETFTDKHLVLILQKFPAHKYKNEIKAELERRKNASKI